MGTEIVRGFSDFVWRIGRMSSFTSAESTTFFLELKLENFRLNRRVCPAEQHDAYDRLIARAERELASARSVLRARAPRLHFP